MVATGKPFLAGESIGTYVSWFNAPAGAQAIKSATNSGQMEGTIDLVSAFGYLPTNIYLCSAAYQTADGGAWAASCPSNTGPDIGTNGFLCLPLVALRDNNGDGIYDRVQPGMDFIVQKFSRTNTSFTLDCAAMPGRNYQLSYRDNLTNGGAWIDLPGATNGCGPLQTSVLFTAPATNAQRFYRVRLLP